MTKNVSKSTTSAINELKPDPNNANNGTERGAALLETSLREYGAGRSLLCDKNGVMIAGNKTLEAAASIGLERIRIVETDGTELVVVKRTDLDLADDPRAKALAIADNRVSQVGLSWNADVLQEMVTNNVDLSSLWHENELASLLGIKSLNQVSDHWVDMPEFTEQEIKPFEKIVVSFANKEDYDDFFVRLGMKPRKEKMWFPSNPTE